MIADNPRTSESSHSSTNYLKSKNKIVEMSPILRKIIYKSEKLLISIQKNEENAHLKKKKVIGLITYDANFVFTFFGIISI